ncbi:MAG: hypothetical protein L6R36_002462 [Xanthoria steineri]|nr:MAG: hypothetical protein L6R36_002462 [Xanthoria steineri]
MAPQTESHHHRSTTKIPQKPFKSRHATKSYIKELTKGKVERGPGSRKTPHQQVMSKIDRRHQAKQIRQIKHKENVKSTSVFAGPDGAPRLIAVLPLCEDCDAAAAIQKLHQSVIPDSNLPVDGPLKVRVERFGQSVLYMPVKRDLVAAMDACRVADFVIFLLSPDHEVGEDGEQLIRAIESQGVSNVLTMVQNLNTIQPPKKQPQIVSSLKSYINHFFPNQDKVHSVDSDRECANVIRSLCTTTPKGVVWREDRSWILVEDVHWSQGQHESSARGGFILTGVVRGKGLKADRLLQVGDWGHFQIEKITDASLPTSRKRKADEMTMDPEQGNRILQVPDEDQDDLDELAPYDEAMTDLDNLPASEAPSERKGVLLDDHHYFSDEDQRMPPPPKKLPKGTSNYQSAWFLGDDMSDLDSSESDQEEPSDSNIDVSMAAPLLPQDEPLSTAHQGEATETTPSEYPQSEAFLNPSPADEAQELSAYRSSRKTSAKEDLEFPDEIELHPNVLARERLSRYRGLRSLKTSTWDTTEDKPHQPQDYDRLLPIPDYKSARKIAVREALVGGVPAGKRVSIHLRNVPLSLQKSHKPLSAFSLLRHEHKRTVINTTITLPSSASEPLPSKSQLVVQIGSRRFLTTPLFSQSGSTPNDVHKYLRFLHPGQTAVASFIAPVTWGSIPVLFFLPSSSSSSSTSTTTPHPQPHLHLTATGTTLPPSPSRTIAKRIILTGHPYKIHKKLVTVRYMFFNKEDVEWFKALRLWTKRGRQGFVRESLGTHGYFKAVFDGKVGPMDAVGVSLYKRVWPRGAKGWGGEMVGDGEERMAEEKKNVDVGEGEVVMGDAVA